MKITILAVGKIKEKWMRAGIQEYVKRLTPFSKWEELEQNEVKMPDNCFPVMKEKY